MGVSDWGAFKEAIRENRESARKDRKNRIIAKYKLRESIRAKFKNLGAEDLADDIIEYINLLLNENE